MLAAIKLAETTSHVCTLLGTAICSRVATAGTSGTSDIVFCVVAVEAVVVADVADEFVEAGEDADVNAHACVARTLSEALQLMLRHEGW